MKVPLAPIGLRKKDIDAVTRVLNSGQLTMGDEVSSFEREMANYLKSKYFVMVNSGSSANLAMIEALIRPSQGNPLVLPGEGILVPAIAWPTTIWPIIQLGLVPYFVDIDPETLAIDLTQAQHMIDKQSNLNIRALFPIHPLGYGIDRLSLERFAKKNNLVLISDVCESLGSWQEDVHSGTSGLMTSFSFYFSHHMTTMEGGGVCTNNPIIYDDLKSIRSHGWSRDRSDVEKWSIDVHPSMHKFTFVSSGYNIRPMEIQAAIGRQQLLDLEYFVQKRRENVARIIEALHGTPFHVIASPRSNVLTYRQHSWMHVSIRIKGAHAFADRLKVVRFLEDQGIETRPPLTGNFLKQPAMEKYKSLVQGGDEFPMADLISKSTFLVGCNHELSDEQIEYLCRILKLASKLVVT